MNGVHDMGGMHGLGPFVPDNGDGPFHGAWEGRVHAMTLASPSRSNIDAGRHQRELIPGPAYLRMTYYEKWFTSLVAMLLKGAMVTEEEVESGRSDTASPKSTPHLLAAAVASVQTRPASYEREVTAAPRFLAGDRVRALNINPTGHTRLPRYARGRTGVVERHYGAHVLPDSHAHGLGEAPTFLYSVKFEARELWGPEANARDSVRLDLWETYLERA